MPLRPAACALIALFMMAGPAAPQQTGDPRPPPRPSEELSREAPQPSPEPREATSGTESGSPAFAGLRESDFDHSACLLALHLMGTDYTPLPQVTDPGQRDCGIARPVEVRRILPGVTLHGAPLMRCETARRLALWTRDFVIPAGHMLPGRPRLDSIEPGSTYDCRDIRGAEGGRLSEHALGNAVDIMALGFRNGLRVPIEPRQDQGDLFEAFQKAIRSAACLHFTTVLGPGSDAAHDDHLHLDIKTRTGSYRLCQ